MLNLFLNGYFIMTIATGILKMIFLIYPFSYLFICAFHKYLFNIYCIPGNTVKMDAIFTFLEPILLTTQWWLRKSIFLDFPRLYAISHQLPDKISQNQKCFLFKPSFSTKQVYFIKVGHGWWSTNLTKQIEPLWIKLQISYSRRKILTWRYNWIKNCKLLA